MDIESLYIEPGSPWQNGFAESFFSRFRDEFLATEKFQSLALARRLTRQWQTDYNQNRPLSSLGYVTPAEFATRCTAAAPAPASPQPTFQQHSELT